MKEMVERIIELHRAVEKLESLRWLVFVIGSTVDEPIAAFKFSDMAYKWAKENYPGRSRIIDWPGTKRKVTNE